jgi:NAD+ synthase
MARTRMTILYYYANQMNRLVCGTSNYTEYVLGYCTKYGDNAADVSLSSICRSVRFGALQSILASPEGSLKRLPQPGLA